MSTDLHEALREAVADAPFDEPDLRTVLHEGARRVRRRTALRIGSSALVLVAAALTVVVVSTEGSDPEPLPADVVHLDLSQAERQDLDVLASVRTTWRDPVDELDQDRFEGLTTDGLVVRSRYTSDGDVHELGLLDPQTGTTDWLPPPPRAAETVVELTADRLVLWDWGELLTFDRSAETWERTIARLPSGLEAHVPFRLALADGRLWLGSTFEGESGPLSWWSYAVPEGGAGRPEPELAGAAVAWQDGTRASAHNDGRVVLSSSAGEQVVSEERPQGCPPPTDPGLATMPVTIALAGTRPVVTYWCGEQAQATTLVYDVDGRDAIQVAGAAVRAADGNHVLLSPGVGQPGGVYLLDTERLTLARVGASTHDDQVGLVDGLVLWNEPGPADDKDVYDVVWKVASLPDGP